MFVIGQSLECWRQPLAGAVARRDSAPLLARAHRQCEAGAHALDLNFGARPQHGSGRPGLAADLAWAAGVLHEALPGVPLFLDCGDLDALAIALPGLRGPVVVNALPVETPQTPGVARLLRTAADSGAGVVCSPRTADASDAPEAVLPAAEEMLTLATGAGLRGPLYLDCLAYPAATHAARCRRSLSWLRLLRRAGPPGIEPLVAVGNVGHGASAELRARFEALYVVLATGAGATALLLRAEDSMLMSLIEVMTSIRGVESEIEQWARRLQERPLAPPPAPLSPAPLPPAPWRAAWDLLLA